MQNPYYDPGRTDLHATFTRSVSMANAQSIISVELCFYQRCVYGQCAIH